MSIKEIPPSGDNGQHCVEDVVEHLMASFEPAFCRLVGKHLLYAVCNEGLGHAHEVLKDVAEVDQCTRLFIELV